MNYLSEVKLSLKYHCMFVLRHVLVYCVRCSAALDVPVPHEALVSEGPRRAMYHANRAAAYLEKYKEAAATAAAAANTQGTTPADASSSADSSPARWREVGGVLDGLMLDSSSPEAQAQLLQAAVMDCKAALDLVPTHAKAHFRCARLLQQSWQAPHRCTRNTLSMVWAVAAVHTFRCCEMMQQSWLAQGTFPTYPLHWQRAEFE